MKVASATATSVQWDRSADTLGTSTMFPAGLVWVLVMVSSPSGVGLSMTTLRDVRHRGIPRPSARRLGRRYREKVRRRSRTDCQHHERDNAKAGARRIPGQRRTAGAHPDDEAN